MQTSIGREQKPNETRDDQDEERAEAQLEPFKPIQNGTSVRETFAKLKTRFRKLHFAWNSRKFEESLVWEKTEFPEKLTNPALNIAGSKHFLTQPEQQMIFQAAIRESVVRKAWHTVDMRLARGEIAHDGPFRSFQTSILGQAVLRKLRAHHPELTFRNKTNKKFCKLQGEKRSCANFRRCIEEHF